MMQDNVIKLELCSKFIIPKTPIQLGIKFYCSKSLSASKLSRKLQKEIGKGPFGLTYKDVEVRVADSINYHKRIYMSYDLSQPYYEHILYDSHYQIKEEGSVEGLQ